MASVLRASKIGLSFEDKEQLINFRLYEKVQQMHKRTETDNDGRTVIHWYHDFLV